MRGVHGQHPPVDRDLREAAGLMFDNLPKTVARVGPARLVRLVGVERIERVERLERISRLHAGVGWFRRRAGQPHRRHETLPSNAAPGLALRQPSH